MRKFLIIIIVLLVILALGQSIYYKINQPKNISPSIDSIEETAQETLYIIGMSDIYDKYNPKIQFDNLQKRFYSFINVNLPEIFKNIYKKNVQEIKQYYEENTDKIHDMYIYQEEEFISIAKQLQNIYNDQNAKVNIENYEVDTNSITSIQDGLIGFDVIFYYDNNTTLKVKFILSENTENMMITSVSDVDMVFGNYTGNVKKSEFLGKLDSLISNVMKIREDSTLKTKNEKMQYYDLNKETLNNIGIYSAEDYISIANQINAMKWKNQDINYINFEVENESIVANENNFNFKVKLFYSYDSEMELIVKLRMNNENEPDVSFSGVVIENQSVSANS